MQYQHLKQPIPQDKRQEVNSKILQLVDIDSEQLTKEEVYNLYTGDGGLHGLDRNDYSNYYAYSRAKQEVENGQFFTPHQVAESMVKVLQTKEAEFIADITCGAGVFFNFFKSEYCFGTDLDIKAIKVAKFLYPEASIEVKDIRYYDPGLKVDTVIGNPPFNLKWDWKGKDYSSQFYYVKKAAEILKPAGILMFVCPESFLKDEFYAKSAIEQIEADFNFVCQYKIDKAAFKDVGVKSFATKVMIFQKVSEHLTPAPFKNVYVTEQVAFDLMTKVNQVKVSVRAKVMLEIARDTTPEFDFRIKKFMYELKIHKKLKELYPKALAYLEKYNTQKCPENVEFADWYKNQRITDVMVISYLKRAVAKQSIADKEEIKVISYQYGFKIKGYSSKTRKIVKALGIPDIKKYELLGKDDVLPNKWRAFTTQKEWVNLHKRLAKFKVDYKIQSFKLATIKKEGTNYSEAIKYLNKFTFISKGKECKFIDIQKKDLASICQKKYSILNWQMGGGKTPAAFAFSKYEQLKNTFIVSASLAINLTWIPFLKNNNQKFVVIQKESDISKIQDGDYILVTMEYASKYQRQLKRFIKSKRQKVTMIFDESDEITSQKSIRTKAILNIFRRCKRKLLATGTTTRNNITELYSQLELLYNNSHNMLCECFYIYKEDFVKDEGNVIKKVENKYYNKPFPAYKGNLLFKRCFNPSKSTVFGIQKHNQDIYNEESLHSILEKTIVTKKFKDIAGDKYTVKSVIVTQKPWEKAIYKKIITEFQQVGDQFFKSTGNSRKDAMLRILRQIDLMIRAVSIPQVFDNNNDVPAKFEKIKEMVADFTNEKVAIGCTSVEGMRRYGIYMQESFPERPLFIIDGQVNFLNRGKMLEAFEATENGILVSTQQSLKSSINVPSCTKVIVESLQWNIPKMEQWYFRFIRYDSQGHTNVYFVNYENTIEMNLMALLMAKERLNDYIKTLDFKGQDEIFEQFGVDTDILNSLMTRDKDADGHAQVKWGDGNLV